LLFLPGAMVDPHAYAPMARAVAERGYRVSVLSLPLRQIPFEGSVASVMTKAAKTIESDTSMQRRVTAGHSKGGKMMARFAHDHADLLDGLILMGTSHPEQMFDLSRLHLDVTKIYATRDGLASPAEVKANRQFLPAKTHWVAIGAGNHTVRLLPVSTRRRHSDHQPSAPATATATACDRGYSPRLATS
jgi:predicted alpha/beta-hydrolase family hydrolase